MRTWNNTLYLGAMPGREKPGRPLGDFSGWLQEMQENTIRVVVCLAPDEQIAADSPEYSEWRRARLDDAHGTANMELIDIPVDDYRAPEPFVAARFWRAAANVSEKIDRGERVFVHCGAGIGRTGMFAVAVLMQKGYSFEDAYREIDAIGSHPEVVAQREFLKKGPVPEDS